MATGFFEFFKAAVRNPLQISTVFQSSANVGKRFARHLQLRDDQVVVELGVGAGAITEHLLPSLKSPQQYIGFELNPDLHVFLKEKFPHLEIHADSAVNLSQYLKGRKVGAVVSTLPWSLFPEEQRRAVFDEIYAALEPGGIFEIFLAYHVLWTPAIKSFLAALETRFPNLTYEDEFRNIPPCRIFVARKT